MLRLRLLAACLMLVPLACNMPRLVIPEATRTPAPTSNATNTPPPSPTIPPLPLTIEPLPTPAPIEPLAPEAPPAIVASPPVASPGAASAATPPAAVTQPPPPTNAPTQAEVYPTPEARALFEGSFTGGRLAFRIGANSASVIPKSVHLKAAACKEGDKTSQDITFEPPPEYAVEKGRFTIYDGVVTIFGQFQSRDRAIGNISVRLVLDGGVCTVGPLPWVAAPRP